MILAIIAYGFLAFFVWFLFRILALPWIKYIPYWRQGLPFDFFFPIIGAGYLFFIKNKTIGDPSHQLKKAIENSAKPMFITNTGHGLQLYLLRPDLIREFYLADRSLYSVDTPLHNILSVNGKGLVFLEGQPWKKHRRVLSELFHFEHLSGMVPFLIDFTIKHFTRIAQDPNIMQNFNILHDTQELSGTAVLRLFFGTELKPEESASMVRYMEEAVLNTFFLIFDPLQIIFGTKIVNLRLTEKHRKIKDAGKFFRDFAKSVIKAQRDRINSKETVHAETKHKGLFELLIERNLKAASTQPEDIFTDDEICDEFLTFFVAGMDTTSHLITFIINALIERPDDLARIRSEVSAKFKTLNDLTKLTIDDLTDFPYLTAFIHETGRLYPVGPQLFETVASRDHTLGDYTITAGTHMTVAVAASLRNPTSYKDPDEFRPERWLNEEAKAVNPYCDILFSAGPRNCIGQHLARLEAKLITILFIQFFDFAYADPTYKMKIGMKFLYEPLEPLYIKLTPRKQ